MLDFQFCRIAAPRGSEDGCICVYHGIVYALLVRMSNEAGDDQGWFLAHGFGPCDREGLIFASVEEAGEWIRQCAQAGPE
jgi:hypothetical protein